MPRLLTIALLAAACLAQGCAQYWYQEGRTFEQCQQDRLDCFDELRKRSDLTGTGDYEFKFMQECMQQKGYRLVKEDELPLDARRETPKTSLDYRMKGIAGSIEPGK
jgi:hypothetical protein